jgi:catechol 2,3-dioxygenase-like lactoylglutathione lyase family enzyme
MTAPAALSHFGIHVTDMARMEEFYTRALGLLVSDRGALPNGPTLVFLSRDPDEHHQLVLVTGRPPDAGYNVVNQISFKLPSLTDLKAAHARLKETGRKEFPHRHPRQRVVRFTSRSRGQSRRAVRGHAVAHAAAVRRAVRHRGARGRDHGGDGAHLPQPPGLRIARRLAQRAGCEDGRRRVSRAVRVSGRRRGGRRSRADSRGRPR